jgi:hypothetical protein
VLSFTNRSLHLHGKSPRHLLYKRIVRPQSRLGHCEEENPHLFLQESNFGHPAIPTELSRLRSAHIYNIKLHKKETSLRSWYLLSWYVSECLYGNRSFNVHKSSPLTPVLNQVTLVHISHANSWKRILMLPIHQNLRLVSAFFSSYFPNKLFYDFRITLMHATFLTHLIFLRFLHANNIWFSTQIMKLLIMYYFPFPFCSLYIKLKKFPQPPSNLCSSFRTRENVSHANTTFVSIFK